MHETGGWPFHKADSAEADMEDRRHGRRHTLLLQTAKFVADGLELLCIVREVSETGVKLQLFYPVPPASSFALETLNGDFYPVALVWTTGDLAGFRFLEGIDLPQFIHASAAGNVRKYIRLQNEMRGTLTADGIVSPVSFINISQQGACVECDTPLAIDQLVAIGIGALRPTFAKVRWRQRPRYGLIFEQTYRFEELARKLAPQSFP